MTRIIVSILMVYQQTMRLLSIHSESLINDSQLNIDPRPISPYFRREILPIYDTYL